MNLNLLIQSGEHERSLGYTPVTKIDTHDTKMNLSAKESDTKAKYSILELDNAIRELKGDIKHLNKVNKELIIKKYNYKANNDRLIELKHSFWKRLEFLFLGI